MSTPAGGGTAHFAAGCVWGGTAHFAAVALCTMDT